MHSNHHQQLLKVGVMLAREVYCCVDIRQGQLCGATMHASHLTPFAVLLFGELDSALSMYTCYVNVNLIPCSGWAEQCQYCESRCICCCCCCCHSNVYCVHSNDHHSHIGHCRFAHLQKAESTRYAYQLDMALSTYISQKYLRILSIR